MSLQAHVFTAPAGARGFDANAVVDAPTAASFFSHGYQFCLRYVRRDAPTGHDLTAGEAEGILEAGLALMPVQHVRSETSWTPSEDAGAAQGTVAASECADVGVPAGATVWCDLEGVDPAVSSDAVVGYCNAWHAAVAAAGYVPGLYVGWRSGLTATQLYRALRYTHYWGAYNLNVDQVPAVRGLQMRQRECAPLDRVPACSLDFQVDTIRADALGGLPTLIGPDGWLARAAG